MPWAFSGEEPLLTGNVANMPSDNELRQGDPPPPPISNFQFPVSTIPDYPLYIAPPARR